MQSSVEVLQVLAKFASCLAENLQLFGVIIYTTFLLSLI